jgi:acyl-CoA synthetase (AMP-forming)/AMP-acid ligase II
VFGSVRSQLQLVLGRGVHLGALTQVLADTYGDRVAVDDPAPTPGLHAGGERSFAELEAHVGRLAAAHHAAGHAGHRVVIATGNRIDVVLHVLALARIDAVAIPVNPRLRPHELEAVAEATGAERAVTDARRGETPPAFLLGGRAPQLPAAVEATTSIALGEWNEQHPDARVGAPEGADPAALAVLLTTSGTTGAPKAAALTSRGLLGGIGLLRAAPVGLDGPLRGGRDRLLASLPLSHVMGLATTLACWCAGLPLLRRHRFDAAQTLDLIESERPNAVVAVPTMYADLEAAGAADRDLSSVQLWVSAADVMPLDRARRFQRYGAAGRVAGRSLGSAAFVDVYGMVELSGAAAVRVLPPSPVGSLPAPQVARTLPGFDVRVVDEDGEVLGAGATGELQFRGPGVLAGYEGRPDAGPDADGWLSTGDHGRIFPGGFFQFSGRAKDRLKVGGFTVFPAEVETELRDAPGVDDVAMVGVPDDRLGDRPVAVVVAGPDFDDDAFLAWAHEHVAGYRRPRQVVRADHLPRGNNGKLDRAAVTDLAVARLGDDAA